MVKVVNSSSSILAAHVLMTTDLTASPERLARVAPTSTGELIFTRPSQGHCNVAVGAYPSGSAYYFILMTTSLSGTYTYTYPWRWPDFGSMVFHLSKALDKFQFPPNIQECVLQGLAYLPHDRPHAHPAATAPLAHAQPQPDALAAADALLSLRHAATSKNSTGY